MALAMPVLAALVSLVLHATVFPVMLLCVLSIAGLLMRCIDVIVPSFLDEIDRTAASIVLAAVLAPVLCVTGGHMHVDGLMNNTDRRRMNYDGSCVDDFGVGKTPYVNTAVEARLGDTDRHADIGCLR